MNPNVYKHKTKDQYLFLPDPPRSNSPPKDVRDQFEAKPLKSVDLTKNIPGLNTKDAQQAIASHGYYVTRGPKITFGEMVNPAPQK